MRPVYTNMLYLWFYTYMLYSILVYNLCAAKIKLLITLIKLLSIWRYFDPLEIGIKI